jgi:hypothetical protein
MQEIVTAEQILVADRVFYRPILTRFPCRTSMFSEMENVHGEMERVREGFTLVNSDFQ